MARQVRAADDTRTSSAGPPGARDLNRKATERGVAAIRQDARESLDYSVRTYYTKAGITCLQRTTTLPDGVRVRGSHCVTIGEPGEIQITFHPAAVDLGYEEFEQLRDTIPFEADTPERPCDAMGGEPVALRVGRDGGKRAAMAIPVKVAAPNCSWWGWARGEVDRVARRWLVVESGRRPTWGRWKLRTSIVISSPRRF